MKEINKESIQLLLIIAILVFASIGNYGATFISIIVISLIEVSKRKVLSSKPNEIQFEKRKSVRPDLLITFIKKTFGLKIIVKFYKLIKRFFTDEE